MRFSIPVFGNLFRFSSFLVVLAFILAAIPAESESTAYEAPIVACKLEGAGIGVNGSTVVVNGVTITFSNWIPKVGSPGEFVGFTIDKPGYTFTVKAGNELLSGMGTTWSNPNGNSGPNVKAISNINFCMNDGNPNDEALCYLIADNDGFGNNSPDGLTKLNEVFTEQSIGLTGTDHIEALTQDTSTGILYGSDDKRFGRLNTTTGVFTFIGDFGSGSGDQGNIDFLDIDGLAYDPFTKKMYASVRRDGKDDVLIQVNIATGAAIPNAFGPGKTYVVVQKINGLQDIDDIAISTRNGVMYAIQNNAGNDSRLITINKATGATTDIGDLDVPNVEGLGFHPDGRLLGVNGDAHRSVMQIPIDPFTGVTIPVSNLGINGWLDYEGISCLTETDNKIQGTVFVQPNFIDLNLVKNASVTPGANSDQIQYTVTVTNDNTNPVAGPNAPAGAGQAGITVKLYRDNNVIGVFDGGDVFLASTVTGPGGAYTFPISANGDFIVTVDLATVPNLAYLPPDNEEAVQFIGFGETLSGKDFHFYTLTNATGITVSDVFPANATFASAAATLGTYNSGTKIWTLGTLAPGASATLTLNATTTFNGQLINCAEVKTASPTDIDSTPGNGTGNAEDDQDCEPTNHVRPEVDLKLEKSANKSSVELGENIIYTLTLTNESAGSANNVIVKDVLPFGVAFVSSSPAAVYSAIDHSVTWTVASIAGGAVHTLDITVKFDGFSGIMPTTNWLADGEYVLRNHPVVGDPTPPPFFGLRLDKLFGGKTPITFDFNHAQSDMRMRLEDGGATVVIYGTTWGGQDTGAAFALAGLWDVYFKYDNKASVVAGDDDIEVKGANVELSSGTISPQYTASDFVNGQIFNLGDKAAGGYSFRLGNEDNDLGHRGHNGISGWGWVTHNGDGVMSYKSASDWIFTAFPIPDDLLNCAQIMASSKPDTDSTPGNAPAYGQEDDDPCFSIPREEEDPEIDLNLEKTADKSTAALGETIVYTLTLTNQSLSNATDIVITDELPYGVKFVSSNPAAVYNSVAHTVTWTVGALAGGASTALNITVLFDGMSGNMPASMFLQDGQYVLRNHPDGTVAPPLYGLRLDKLFGNKTPITFDFNHALSDMRMRIEDGGQTAIIYGTTWGGHDVGGSYAFDGLWNVSFTFDHKMSLWGGDDDLVAQGGDAELSSGTITPLYTTADFTAGHIYQLSDKESGGYSFRLGNRSDDLGHRGFPGISGWGWLNHDGNGVLDHKATSDFLFTAFPIPDVLNNCAQISEAGQTDSDSTPGNAPLYDQEDDDPCFRIDREEDPAVDIEVEKTASNLNPNAGDQITYTITVSNNGPSDASNLEITDVLPVGATYVSHIVSAGAYNNGTGKWTLPFLAASTSATLNITVLITGPGVGLSDGVYRLHNHPGNDLQPPGHGLRLDELFGGLDGITFNFDHPSSEVLMTITGSTVHIVGEVFGGYDAGGAYDPALSGLWDVDFEYDSVVTPVPADDDLYVKHANAETSFGTIIPQFSSAHFTAGDVFDLGDKSDGSYSFRLGDETNDLGYNGFAGISGWGWLRHGQNGNLAHTPISDWIFTAVPVRGTIENCAELTGLNETDSDSTPDDGTGDDYSCVTVSTGDPLVDLSLDKNVNLASVAVGGAIQYTLAVTNDAAAGTTATNVVVVDSLPAGVTVTSTVPAANVVVNNPAGTVTWTIPALNPGQTLILTLNAQVNTAGSKVNCAEVVSADQDDVDDIYDDGTGEEFDCAITNTNNPFIDLSVLKTASVTNPGIGDIVDYTIRVRNEAGATATAFGITVVDNVPAGLTIQSTNPVINVSVNNVTNVVSWFIPSLAPGAELFLHVFAKVDQPGVWNNCAQVMAATGTDSDSVPGDNAGDDYSCVSTDTPDPTIDLSLTKTVNNATPTVGQTVTYTLTVNNAVAATETATGVVVKDQLPAGVTIDPGFANPNVTVTPAGLITWNVGSVGAGASKSLNVPVIVNMSTAQINCAQITNADQDDMDSIPNNGIGNGEDDQACVTITPNLIPSNAMCYLVADNENHLGSADVLTYINSGGTEFSVGITGTQNINAIEYVGATGKLYAADGNRFGTLNPATGVFSAIGFFGSGLGSQGAKAFDDVDGLALDPFTGVLYGTVRTTAEDLLIQINLVTGAAITNAFGVGNTYVVIPNVGGFNNVDDIAIEPTTGTMYGVMNGVSGNTKLVTINKTTGASALAATLDVANVRGLAFRSNGQLIGTLASTGNQARRINTSTGVTTLVSNLGINGNFDYEAITCNTNIPNLLSGTVFKDNNVDALLDAGDVGQKDVLVKLYKDTNGNGIFDGPDVFVGSMLSDVDGKYAFWILSTGKFVVVTDLATYPAGAVLTTDNIETANFTAFGQSDINNNFGFKLVAVVLGSIGDTVFNDANANGVQDLGEGGIGGVLVRLYNSACPAVGSPIATRVTSPSGNYTFTGLPAGTYCVDVVDSTVPAGYVHTTANDPMTVALANGQVFLFADFGYYYNLTAAQADLELTKEVDTSSPALDGVVEFTITVRNNGPATATNLIVRDIIPVGLVFQNYTSTRGSYEANKLGFWTIGTLAVGQSETLKIRTKVVITNMIENIAQVSSVDQEDPDSTPGNGVATEDDQDNAIVESRGPGSVGDIIRSECADMGTVNALIYSTFDDQVYAGTEVGSVHISNDDGVNWPSFLQTDNDAPVRDIVVTNAGTVYVGSFGDGVYRSTNSGNNWTNIGPVAGDINDLDLDDNTNYLYAAAYGSVQVYNGATWSTLGAGTNPFAGQQVLAVVFDENNNRVVASSVGSGAYKYQAGVWTAVNTGLPIGKVNELFRGPNGEILAGTNGDGVYIFGGAMWVPFGLGLDKEPIESLGSGPNGELLAGARETGAYFYNFITNTWVSIGNLPIFTVSSMTAGPTGEIYAGAPGEGIYLITDSNYDGIPDIAYQVANFMTSAVIQDIVVAPNGDMWAATYGYGILYSNDGGRCWTRMNRGLENLWTFAIERATDGTLFIGIWADGKGGIWRSRDGGRNWEFLALPTRQIIALAIDPNNEDIIYAGANIAGEGALFQSTDGGDTWHSQGLFIQPVWSVTIDPDNSNHILVGTLGDGIHESFDSGFTFAPMGGPVNGLANPYVFDLEYAPIGTPYAGQLFAGTNAGMYRYDEFAGTWSLFGIGSEAFQFRTMAFSGTTIYGGTWNSGVVEYNALTNEWGDFGLGDIPVIAFAVHPQTQTLIIGTSGSGVFLSTNFRMSTSIEDEVVGTEIPKTFSLEANYPNPFNPQTTIPFSVQSTGQVRLAIYDMLGRQVGLLIDGPLAAGQHQVTWEAGDRPSGSYLVRMDAGGQTFTRTMVLLK